MLKTRYWIFVFAVLTGCGCGSAVPEVGKHDRDNVKLTDASSLGHVQEALSGGTDLAVADLFDPKTIAFDAAPDPSALLQAHQAANAERSAGTTELKVLSYNVALLDAKIFGFIDWSQSPN